MNGSRNLRLLGVTLIVALILSVAHTEISRADCIYVSNGGDGTIKAVTLDGAVSTFASGLDTPRGLAFDSGGNLYVACAGDLTIRKITPGGQVSTFASLTDDPYGVAVMADNIYVAQNLYYAGAVLQFTPGGSISTFAAGDFYPGGLVRDGNGGFFVANSVGEGLGGVQRIDSSGNVTAYVALGLDDPIGLVRDASSRDIYTAEFMGAKRVLRIAADGSVHDFATGVGTPYGLVVTGGYIYSADFTGGAINKINSSGNVTSFVTGLSSPRFMTLGPNIPEPAGISGTGRQTVSTGGGVSHAGGLVADFSNITTLGTLYVSFSPASLADMVEGTGPLGAGPITFAVPSGSSDVQMWSVSYSGSFSEMVSLTFDYDPSGMTIADQQALQIYHYTNGQWVDLLGTVNVADHTITVNTDSFSPFALGVPEPATLGLLVLGGLAMLRRTRR